MHRRELLGTLGLAALGTNLQAAHDDKPKSPMAGHLHFCGIHLAKNNPKFQLVTQHYCAGHTTTGEDDMFQCVLFDGTSPNAKLLGVEYLISDAAYRKLPDAEKKYWHPHTYEVLGGGLVAPGMAPAEEKKFMGMILTTWGKAWHTWPDPSTNVPIGEPLLIWSATGDGQIADEVIAKRDQEFGIDTKSIRAARTKELGYEVPQVPQVKMNENGRQWTASGEDKPTKN